jgi:hypothetical protein
MSSDDTLRSGTNVIHSVLDTKNDERLIVIPDTDSRDATGQVPVKTQLGGIYSARFVLSIHRFGQRHYQRYLTTRGADDRLMELRR